MINIKYKKHPLTQIIITALCIGLPGTCLAEIKLHPTAIQGNNFANALVRLSDHLIRQQDVISKESLGGYGGLTNDLEFYKEIKTIRKNDDKLISIVRWETKNPSNLHDVVVNIYDEEGRIIRDYSATYLPVNRGAPYQTLINLHFYKDSLTGYRQFDAHDDILYEHCKGMHNGRQVSISLEYYDIPDRPEEIKDKELRQAYIACFEGPVTAAPYTDPLVEIKDIN